MKSRPCGTGPGTSGAQYVGHGFAVADLLAAVDSVVVIPALAAIVILEVVASIALVVVQAPEDVG